MFLWQVLEKGWLKVCYVNIQKWHEKFLKWPECSKNTKKVLYNPANFLLLFIKKITLKILF